MLRIVIIFTLKDKKSNVFMFLLTNRKCSLNHFNVWKMWSVSFFVCWTSIEKKETEKIIDEISLEKRIIRDQRFPSNFAWSTLRNLWRMFFHRLIRVFVFVRMNFLWIHFRRKFSVKVKSNVFLSHRSIVLNNWDKRLKKNEKIHFYHTWWTTRTTRTPLRH